MTYSFAVDNENFCCGVYQIGKFGDYIWYAPETADTPEEVLKIAAEEVPKGCMIEVWFMKCKKSDGSFEKEYQYRDLRALVQKIPNVVHIGKTINPNSGNRIDGYAWVNQGPQ